MGDVSKFLTLLKQRLSDHFLQNWNYRLAESSRASFYRVIGTFKFQPYLDKVTTRKFRVALSKLRMSSHRLMIEVGRWNRPHRTPREQRKCTVCNQLEDEYHFLFECRLYNDERTIFLKPYYLRNQSMYKTIELMQETNSKTLKKLAMFVLKCFEIRTDYILHT